MPLLTQNLPIIHWSLPCETRLFIPSYNSSSKSRKRVNGLQGVRQPSAEAWRKENREMAPCFYWRYTQKIQTCDPLLLLTPAWQTLKTTKSREADGCRYRDHSRCCGYWLKSYCVSQSIIPTPWDMFRKIFTSFFTYSPQIVTIYKLYS